MSLLKVDKYILWIIGIVFAVGVIYASILKIPELENRQVSLENRVSIIETHYVHIQLTLDKIERKIK